MMTNLFSMFDPSFSIFSFSLFSGLVFLIFIPLVFWLGGSFYSLFLSFFYLVNSEVDYILSFPKKGVYSFIGSVFLSISFYNFLALFPFLFSMTSHLMTTLPLSFSFWLGIIIFSWVSSLKHFLSHLIPIGTPLGLVSFMVLVEILSNFIRPLALTFRLTANMMAGHLLMSLVGGALLSSPTVVFLSGFSLQFLLVFMELGVSLIQAYVFSTLLLLYVSESSH